MSNERDEFVDQPEPVYGLRSRCLTAAREIKHAIRFPNSEAGGSLIEIAGAIFDVVELATRPRAPAPPSMDRIQVACHVLLADALERETGRHGDVDVVLSDEAVERLSPEAKRLLIAGERYTQDCVPYGPVRLPDAARLIVVSDAERDVVEAIESHARRMTEEAVTIVSEILAGDPTAKDAQRATLPKLLPPDWAAKVIAWNAALAAAAAERKARRAEADSLLVARFGTPSQRDRFARGVLPKDEMIEIRRVVADVERDRVLPRAEGFPLFVPYREKDLESHRLHKASFGYADETEEISAAAWSALEGVQKSHPGAKVTLFRHTASCGTCGVVVATTHGIRVEIDGVRRSYAMPWERSS